MQVDPYEAVTQRIIELIESGQATADGWTSPFIRSAAAGLPENAVTKRAYRGVNILMLWAAAQMRGFPVARWASYRQWQSAGRQVRRAPEDWPKERRWGETVVFFKVIERRDEESDDPKKKKRIPLLRLSTVFNEAQLSDWEPPEPVERGDEPERRAEADEFIEKIGAKIEDSHAIAAYDPLRDVIELPPLRAFHETEGYYSVVLHEHVHWTGHADRLDRQSVMKARFGSEGYAMEELVAELGSAFVCAALGLEPVAREDHANYVANWLTVLRNDKKAIVTAASKASDAADYLRERGEGDGAGT